MSGAFNMFLSLALQSKLLFMIMREIFMLLKSPRTQNVFYWIDYRSE